MNKQFKLPDLGENIIAADIIRVLIKAGEFVEEDQSILEIETDKATIEVPSSIAGTVKGVYVKEGEKVSVGQVVFDLVEGSSTQPVEIVQNARETNQSVSAPAVASSDSSNARIEMNSNIVELILQELGENITEAEVVKVLVALGDEIKDDQGVLEIETDKATIEVPSNVTGKIIELNIEQGKKVKVGQVILKVEKLNAAPKVTAPAPVIQAEVAKVKKEVTESIKPAVKINTAEAVVPLAPPKVLLDIQPPILKNSAPAAPSVRRLARELGVDVNKIPGSGEQGRISLADVKNFVKKLNENRVEAVPQAPVSSGFGIPQIPLPDFTKFGEINAVPMTGIRTKTAERLSYAWQTIPHVTQFDKADITSIEEIRKSFSPKVQQSGGKLTMTGILVKVVAAALKQFPQFNAAVDMNKKELIYKKYFNVGIAVDTEYGLIVPVIKNVGNKSLTEISTELNTISEKARARKISLDDLQGGCFTISNLGGIGGTYFTPIINSPEVAILGVSRSGFEPVYKNGEFVPRLMLPLSLSYDHRIIDGADGIRFLRWVISALEQPFQLLI